MASPRLICTFNFLSELVCDEISRLSLAVIFASSDLCSGIALKELGYRRSDLIITTKLFWGTRRGPNDMGLSRKQCVKQSVHANAIDK